MSSDEDPIERPPGSRRPRRRRSPISPVPFRFSGGRFAPLDPNAIDALLEAALDILAATGMAEAPADVLERVTAAGGRLDADGRLLFPPDLVRTTLASVPHRLSLCGRDPTHDLDLGAARVHVGTGGAAPLVRDLSSGKFRPSVLADLYDAARLVDRLENVHFFSRSVVAGDMPDDLTLDVNTAFASLSGTTKHVMTSVQNAEGAAAVAKMCHLAAGGEAAFRERPFLSLNVNHVVPPLRFSADGCSAMAAAAAGGIPVHINTFGQLGASSPVTIAGCVAQTLAETLAGLVYARLVEPSVKAVFGMRPMITDLRTGGMAGGCGEQALLTAIAVQLANRLGLPNSTIAGATDSKVADVQSGYEKALSITLAAQSGCNLVTQACGMHAGLMACSLESYVIDNEMLGTILRTLTPVEVSADTLALASIDAVVRGEGHFLGETETLARMQTDFLYPSLADRRPPDAWVAAGSPDIRALARAEAERMLAERIPSCIPVDAARAIRDEFDIRLP